MNNNKFALIILDGWGKSPNPAVDAIEQADTPFLDSLISKYPVSFLKTYGKNVGLPDGQMGNSEVGHMNIGAGHIIFQDLVEINQAVKNHQLESKPEVQNLINYAKTNSRPIHLLGLVSDGGVHSHITHLLALIDIFDNNGIISYIHAFMDGRDTDPKSGLGFIKDVQNRIKQGSKSRIATISGRFYAMDRDKRWERVKIAYDALVRGSGIFEKDPIAAIEHSYHDEVTDEFIKPVVIVKEDQTPVKKIEDGDAVLFFNFRSDRPRELTTVLTQKSFPEFDMHTLDLYFATMTNYDDEFQNIHVVFGKQNLENTLGEIISKHNKTQLRIAETEKYAHVTFFFSGGREEEFPLENRILIPSPKVNTYDLKPEMSANEVANAVVNELKTSKPDLIVLNFANGDMVGHTGVFEAAVKAAEAVDRCLSRIVPLAVDAGYNIFITADHGNADNMINPDGSPNTAHSLNPVELIFVNENSSYKNLKDGKLADIAPSILTVMDIAIPVEMNGEVLVSK